MGVSLMPECNRGSRGLVLCSLLLFLAGGVLPATGQTRTRRVPAPVAAPRTTGQPAAPAAAPDQPRFTGIWEPVNYPDDVKLTHVFFVSPRSGWALGYEKGGVIVHTADGGEHWNVQVGDPQSDTPEFRDLYFIDQVHGWVWQKGDRLLRTSDGANWQEAGALPKFVPYHDYAFTSASNGVFMGGYVTEATKIFFTRDGGRSWKPSYVCAVRLQVQGLTRNAGCELLKLSFPSATVGYAVGGGSGYAVVAKTEDGGINWRVIFASTDLNQFEHVFFSSETTGIVSSDRGEKVYYTTDGGQNWRGVIGHAEKTRYADPQVAWSCYRKSCSFSADGGQSWTSREFVFPTYVNDFSLPRRDRAYVIGEHGMVYRYRIIPVDQVAKNMILAPLMPGYGGDLNVRLRRMRDEVRQLRAKLGLPDSPSPAPASGTVNQPASAQNQPGAIHNQISNQVADQPSAAAPNAASQSFQPESAADASTADAGSDYVFQQSTDASGGFGADAGTGFTADAGAGAATGFTQDTSLDAPASSAVQQCCADQMQALQTDMGSFSQQVPSFSGRFKNLNLIFIGLNMFSDLMNRTNGLKQAFLTFKKAPDLQSAAAALQDLAGKLDGTQQAIASGFQSLADNKAPAAGGSFSNMASDATSLTGTGPAPADAGANGNAANNKAQQPANQQNVGDAIKKKVKSRLGISF